MAATRPSTSVFCYIGTALLRDVITAVLMQIKISTRGLFSQFINHSRTVIVSLRDEWETTNGDKLGQFDPCAMEPAEA